MADRLVRAAGSGLTSERARDRMVQGLRALGIRHEGVLAAMGGVPRHAFVDQGLASRAYEDVALPIGQGQTISKPSTVARMIELAVRDRDAATLKAAKVLEVGTGCGYQAAVLAAVFGEVVSVERLRWLHETARTNIRPMRLPNLRLVFGDGRQGVEAAAPYDAVVVAAAGEGIPDPLLMQMKVGGTLVAPVAAVDGSGQSLHLVERRGRDDWTLTVLDAVRFVPLRRGTS
ncbi:MAG: Protein-L-isoaspartate O-methyltransferase [Pseudomonadota bacterium]|jgi:protein-L-isoaspartate(D-aspartate) O-methyltransferase